MPTKIEIKANIEDLEKIHIKGHFMLNDLYMNEVTLAGLKQALNKNIIPKLKENCIT